MYIKERLSHAKHNSGKGGFWYSTDCLYPCSFPVIEFLLRCISSFVLEVFNPDTRCETHDAWQVPLHPSHLVRWTHLPVYSHFCGPILCDICDSLFFPIVMYILEVKWLLEQEKCKAGLLVHQDSGTDWIVVCYCCDLLPRHQLILIKDYKST